MDVELKTPPLIAYIFTHAPELTPSNRRKSHVPNLRGGQNRDIHLTFSGPRLQHGYRPYVTITKPRCARQQIGKDPSAMMVYRGIYPPLQLVNEKSQML